MSATRIAQDAAIPSIAGSWGVMAREAGIDPHVVPAQLGG